jgi:hypothetical protein
MYYTWERCKIHTTIWLENLKGTDHLEDLGIGGKIILEWITGKQGGKVWTGCIWLRTGTSSRPPVNTVMHL